MDKDQYLTCPECKQSNTVEFWDRNTKHEAGIEEGKPFVSAGEDKDTHSEVQSFYHCPICNEEIEGVDLQK